jgi:hypothetical protein
MLAVEVASLIKEKTSLVSEKGLLILWEWLPAAITGIAKSS